MILKLNRLRDSFIKSNPRQLDWIRFPSIPLADIDVLILVDTPIVTVLKYRFLLKHDLQDSIVVMRLLPTWIGHHPIFGIQNSNESRVIRLLQIPQSGPTNTRIQILSMNNRPANISAW